MTKLKGMTWDHSRGYDPMIATSKVFEKKHNNEVFFSFNPHILPNFRGMMSTIYCDLNEGVNESDETTIVHGDYRLGNLKKL